MTIHGSVECTAPHNQTVVTTATDREEHRLGRSNYQELLEKMRAGASVSQDTMGMPGACILHSVYFPTVQPPSIINVVPVTNAASSLAR